MLQEIRGQNRCLTLLEPKFSGPTCYENFVMWGRLLGFSFVAALCLGACEGAVEADVVGLDNATGTDGPCLPGTLECECEGVGSCDEGLVCDAFDRCVPVGTATGFAEDGYNPDGSCNADMVGCSEQASCVVVDGEPSCVCDEGWAGSGEICYELDEF